VYAVVISVTIFIITAPSKFFKTLKQTLSLHACDQKEMKMICYSDVTFKAFCMRSGGTSEDASAQKIPMLNPFK
jgi:hypothetical protein